MSADPAKRKRVRVTGLSVHDAWGCEGLSHPTAEVRVTVDGHRLVVARGDVKFVDGGLEFDLFDETKPA